MALTSFAQRSYPKVQFTRNEQYVIFKGARPNRLFRRCRIDLQFTTGDYFRVAPSGHIGILLGSNLSELNVNGRGITLGSVRDHHGGNGATWAPAVQLESSTNNDSWIYPPYIPLRADSFEHLFLSIDVTKSLTGGPFTIACKMRRAGSSTIHQIEARDTDNLAGDNTGDLIIANIGAPNGVSFDATFTDINVSWHLF